MARKVRIQYPGAIYHAMNRGDRHEPIFRQDRDRELLCEHSPKRATRLVGGFMRFVS